jgi:hypothetical protein
MRASVTVRAQPVWRIRLARELPRYGLYALTLWGILASARYAIAPPRPAVPPAPRVEPPDRAAEAYASLFARRYLSWNATDPQAYQESLSPFLGEGMPQQAGLQLPASGSQEALWVQVVQERRGALGERVYTLACQTSSAGLLYLTVGVLRNRSGALALAGYPALVGPPASASAENFVETFRDVEDPPLAAVIERALRNYLDDAGSELAADLTESAAVSLPGLSLSLDGVQQLRWLPGGGSVFAVLQASDRRGVRYTLAYELDVVQSAGRWEVSAIQMNPYGR